MKVNIKRNWLSICCLIAIAGCSNPFGALSVTDQIRLGTFNLENFDGLNSEKVEAVSQIIERNFDAIGLQEINPLAAEKLKEKLNKSLEQSPNTFNMLTLW